MTKLCETCGREFTVPTYREKKARYCSVACRKTGQTVACPTCGKTVYRKAIHLRRHKRAFCSTECCLASVGYATGHRPWNKNRKGIHLSPASEFKPGHNGSARLAVGAVTYRTDKHGRRRAWVKAAQPNTWLLRSHVVWVASGRALPRGAILHHIDKDSLNDAIDNLLVVTASKHIAYHRDDLLVARGMKENPPQSIDAPATASL